jgi:hypothetical protein
VVLERLACLAAVYSVNGVHNAPLLINGVAVRLRQKPEATRLAEARGTSVLSLYSPQASF